MSNTLRLAFKAGRDLSDLDGFETTFVGFSPIDCADLVPNSPVASPAWSPPLEEHSDSNSPNSSDDDEDGLGDHVGHVADDWEEGSFGDDEQVVVASDHYSWTIDHARGDHKLRGLYAATKTVSFDGNQALDMLQKRYTFDFGSRKAGSRATAPEDEYICSFFLDLLIIGRRLRPITQPSSRCFDNITICRASYSAKHVHGLPFDLEHRTFRVATAATRES
ncbi:hypothetical protein PSPO01_16225 [Paraphaeosphaeria sporulosa]